MAKRPKGGRGKTVPYKSTPVRVPEPLIEQCHEMIDFYQEFLEEGGDPDKPPQYVSNPRENWWVRAEKELNTYTPLGSYPGNSSSEK